MVELVLLQRPGIVLSKYITRKDDKKRHLHTQGLVSTMMPGRKDSVDKALKSGRKKERWRESLDIFCAE
jgi:hypothetical protein